MNKVPGLKRLSAGLSFAAIICLVFSGLAGCNNDNGGGEHKPSYNPEVVKQHIISIDAARTLTRSFRSSIDTFNVKCAGFKEQMKFIHAEEFPADVFNALLAEHTDSTHARGIRIYLGRGADGAIRMVLVPVDSSGNDMIGKIIDLKGKPAPGTARVESLSVDDGQAVEDGQRCPTLCDNGFSGLN